MVIVRRGGVAFVHWFCAGQTWQSVIVNLILITSFLNLSTAGVQLLLVLPIGQIACCCSQSIAKSRAANPTPSFACQWLSPLVGPISSMLYAVLLLTNSTEFTYPVSATCFSGSSCFSASEA